ncbi:hypothetical protein SUDANB15_00127 [Streptomyces sp. enrichment culture]
MLVWPSWRWTPMARLRRPAITRGRCRGRIFEAFSRKVRPRTWWSWFSIFQRPRIHAANALPVAAPRRVTGS